MNRFIKITAGVLVALVVAAGVGLWLFSESRHASASAEAIAALAPDATVVVEEGKYLVFRPSADPPRMGVIFYPGASSDVRGYAPVMRRIAAAGYMVVVVPMPLEFAFLAPNRALDVQAAYPDTRHWAIMGHSLGGAMAAAFVYNHPDAVDGLVIWDSFPAPNNSLAEYGRPVWHIHRARPDGSPPASFAQRRELFPPGSTWVPIPGGIHMYFGDFVGGGYVEEWEASISRAEHQDQAVAATLAALQAIAGAAESR